MRSHVPFLDGVVEDDSRFRDISLLHASTYVQLNVCLERTSEGRLGDVQFVCRRQ